MIQGFLRQNAWGKTKQNLSIVRETGIVHCPWGHTQQDMQDYLSDPSNFTKKYAHIFVEFPVGAKLVVADAGSPEVLIVELTSTAQTGRIPHYAIVRSASRTCHPLTRPGRGCKDGCAECEDSVIQVVRTNTLAECLQENCIIEPFYSIWRSVNVLAVIDTSLPGNEALHDYAKYQASIKGTPFDGTKWLIKEEEQSPLPVPAPL